jgi:hypothetical protein
MNTHTIVSLRKKHILAASLRPPSWLGAGCCLQEPCALARALVALETPILIDMLDR